MPSAETSTKTTKKQISLGLPALKGRCRDLGLKVSGTKAELQERLVNAPASRPRLGPGLRSSSKVSSSDFPALAAAAASGRRGGRMPPPASPSTPHVPALAAAEKAADAEPTALAAPAVNTAAVAAQCRYDAALAKYVATAAEYEANVDEKRENELRELKDEAYANLQSANEYLLTLRSIPDAATSSSRMLESQEVTMPAGVRKRQKLGALRSCLVGI